MILCYTHCRVVHVDSLAGSFVVFPEFRCLLVVISILEEPLECSRILLNLFHHAVVDLGIRKDILLGRTPYLYAAVSKRYPTSVMHIQPPS